MGDFMQLRVWVKAKDLAVFIYSITEKGTFSKDYGLRDQIRRAVVSISSNIAEGEELGTNRQSVKHLYIAKGSCAEVLNQAIIAHEIGYIGAPDFEFLSTECRSISRMINKLIQARSDAVSDPSSEYPESP
jgi:four helix bundle protein